MKNVCKTLFGLIMLVAIVILGTGFSVRADEDDEIINDPILVVSSYEVSGGVIIPGEKFILTVELENTDKNKEAHNILVNLSFSDGVSTVYPTLTQEYIESIEPNTKRKLQFEMIVASYYSRPMAAFGVNIVMDTRSNYVTLYAPVQLDNSMFKVVSKNIPEEVGAGEKISVSLSFKSLLEEKLSNVNLQILVDDDKKPIATTNIGNISAGASKTQNMAFFIDEIGEHTVHFMLSFNSEEGEESNTELYSGKIQVNNVQKENVPVVAETIETTLSDRDKMIIIGCLGAAFLLSIGIVLIVKKYN